MTKINDEMKNLLNVADIWVLATTDKKNVPNAVPIYYTDVLDNDRLLLVDNYMKKTVENITDNSTVSVSVWNEKTGYQFKGTATIETDGPRLEAAKKKVRNREPKGVIVVDVDSVYSTSPGPQAGSRLA